MKNHEKLNTYSINPKEARKERIVIIEVTNRKQKVKLDLNPSILIVTLHVNGLNIPIERQNYTE